MRALFILTGAPGTGKTTLLRELGVENLAVGFDQMRQIFAPMIPCVEDLGAGEPMLETEGSQTMRLRQSDEFAVVQATIAALEARMTAGTTVFFDATSLNISDQNELIRRGAAHGYTSYILDAQGDITFDELKIRNAARGPRALPEEDLREKWLKGAQKEFAPGAKLIDMTSRETILADLARIQRTPRISAERVIVVGDLHSCAAPLQRAINELDAPGTHWVFSGDLFDRGPDPVEVWEIVAQLLIEQRCTVVTGNHESHLRTVNTRPVGGKMPQTIETRNALLEANIGPQAQIDFVNATVPALLFSLDDDTALTWLVTHGGVGRQTAERLLGEGMLHVTEAECIYGLSERFLAYRGKSSYDVERISLSGNQLHGHRNGVHDSGVTVDPVREIDGSLVICLESGASSGGTVSVAVLESSAGASPSARVITYPDEVSPSLAAQNAFSPVGASAPRRNLLERMTLSSNVAVKPVQGFPGVVAANFTRQAFQSGAWDQDSVHARGLFLDESTGEVLARGYEKFFHIGEAPGRTMDDLLDREKTAYPVVAVKKFNGYLALVASVHGRLAVFSKSGRTPYAETAEKMLQEHLGDERLEQLRQMLERSRCTALFEVLRADDPHPITEAGPDRLVLLDTVFNSETFGTSEKLTRGIAARFGFEVAGHTVIGRARGPESLQGLIDTISARSDEGGVLIDARGYRAKVKAHTYASRKSTRGVLERFWSGKADSLGRNHQLLEQRLHEAGVLDDIRAGRFTVTGLDGLPHLDLAGLFDAIES